MCQLYCMNILRKNVEFGITCRLVLCIFEPGLFLFRGHIGAPKHVLSATRNYVQNMNIFHQKL